jgi:hypothetical protein
MNGAHADGSPSATIVPSMDFLIEPGGTYCVPEAGHKYKGEITCRRILANFPAMR